MTKTAELTDICTPSENVVAREIEGELIIVPLVSGVGDTEDELYSLNPTGYAIWKKLDGKRSLREVAALLAEEFDASEADLQRDVLGWVNELVTRRMLVIAEGV